MEPNKDIYNITSYLDGEMNAVEEELIIKNKINSSPDYHFEYTSQKEVKNLLTTRFSKSAAPTYLKERIKADLQKQAFSVYEIKPEPAKEKSFFSSFFDSLFKPVPAFAFAVVIAITLLYFNVSRPDGAYFVFDRESGEFNMVQRAKVNFNKIIKGELTPQSFEVEPQQIKQFFRNAGVKYETVIPECTYWKILGSVVSDCKGEKLAHTVYTSPNGEIMYLFQVDEEHFYRYNTLDISQDLEDMLNTEKYLKFVDADNCIFMWKNGGKIFSLISNGNSETIEHDFLAQVL